jgi:hypothetical protein
MNQTTTGSKIAQRALATITRARAAYEATDPWGKDAQAALTVYNDAKSSYYRLTGVRIEEPRNPFA